MARRWNQERFDKWAEETHIPEDVMVIVNAVCQKIGLHVEEEVVEVRNVWDMLVGFAKGFRITHCTSSYESGPTKDMTPTFLAWLGGLGFSECASYGDNGMDSATNWHDTFWTKEVEYIETEVSNSRFYDWDDEDDDDDDYGYDDDHCSDGYNWRTGEWD